MPDLICRFCEGTGRVSVDRCAEIVHGRQCKNFARNDPAYYELMPDRAWVRPYCGKHGNQRLRAMAAMLEASGEPHGVILDTPPKLSERQFVEQILKYAALMGWHLANRTWNSKHSPSGWPDLVLIRRPRIVFAEIKTDRNHLTAKQRECLEDLRACGLEAYEWHPRDFKSIERILR